MYSNNNFQQILTAVNDRWPYLEANDYNNFNSIIEAFPHLSNVNIEKNQKQYKNKIGLIIRSANDDNVHKAIKYGIWTTTPKNKTKIQNLWQKHLKDQTEVYLFFSVVRSGMFEGVARIASDYYEQTFPFWWQNHSLKFKGFFLIEWIYIKDINYKHFDGLYNVENEEVVKCKDCDFLDQKTTLEMIQIFKKRPLKRYIFDDFEKMDDRQKNYTRKMYEYVLQQQHQQSFYNNFNYNTMINNTQKTNINQNFYGQQMLGTTNPIMSISNQIIGPQKLDQNLGSGMGFLGFQMNPVSKNRKK